MASARRVLADGKSALNWLHREHEIDFVPHIALPAANEPRERVASPEEVAALLRHAPPHLRVYLWIVLGTGARPHAALELTRERIDFGNRLIEFDPHGRAQTKKRRPRLPIADALLPILI